MPFYCLPLEFFYTSTYRYILDSHSNWAHPYAVGEDGKTLKVIRIFEYY